MTKLLTRLIALGLLAIAVPVARAQTVRPCLPSDSTTVQLVRLGAKIVSDTAAWASGVRGGFSIPLADATVVSRVGDDAVCNAVTGALDAKSTQPSAQSLITVAIGTTPAFYLATQSQTGVMGYVFLLDDHYNVLAAFGGP